MTTEQQQQQQSVVKVLATAGVDGAAMLGGSYGDALSSESSSCSSPGQQEEMGCGEMEAGYVEREGVGENRFRHKVPGQHTWKGDLYNAMISKETLDSLQDFEVFADDCIISGYPKSGTTWLEEIVYLVLHQGDTDLANQTPNYIRVPYLEDARTTALCASQARPRIYKSHLRYQNLPPGVRQGHGKVIHIIRDPRDVIVSYYYFYRALAELGSYSDTWEEFFEMFMSGHVVLGSWFDYIAAWWQHRDDPRILFVRYEELLRDPGGGVRNIAAFLGLEDELTAAQIDSVVRHCSFASMRANPMTNFSTARNIDASISPFMRKGKAGDWRGHFSREQSERFEEKLNQEMDRAGVRWFS